MIEFRLMGGLELLDSRGRALDALLVQPKRVALLSYLTLAVPHSFCRRDRLLATFWPELDAEHARAALRQSVHVLRRTLGDGVIRCRGVEDVGVDPRALVCDALEFDEAIADGRPTEALALYRGPLLDGFYASGLPEFECWLELLRSRVDATAVRAARALSRRAEAAGDLEMAVHWANRGMAIAPDDEGCLRELLDLLRRTGDRAAAIRAYERFARRLRCAWQIEPSEEIQSIARGLRSRSHGAAGWSSDHGVKLTPHPPGHAAGS
jgi:DNA-binding SARP family transcriptional activator